MNPRSRIPRRLSPAAVAVAARIVAASSRENPADAVLRAEMKVARLNREVAAQTAGLVFEYFRWFQWLDSTLALPNQIRAAHGIAEKFNDKPSSFPDAELTSRAVPAWIGKELKISPVFARSLQTEPRLWLRTKTGRAEEVAFGLGDCAKLGVGQLANTLRYSGRQDLFRTELFAQGAFELQDVGSQAVGLVCAPEKGSTWWDCCAGEGGKTLHLSDLMGNTGLIWASDRAEWRLRKLKKRAARAQVFNYRLAPWDGGERLPTKTLFDGVLVDAPCSGTGTWQRNPHARWTTTPHDLAELGTVQSELLAHAARAVKKGGRLVYAVCTLTRSETTAVVNRFEQGAPGFEPVPLANPLVPGSAPAPHLWLWPQNINGNGMFVAVWKRV